MKRKARSGHDQHYQESNNEQHRLLASDFVGNLVNCILDLALAPIHFALTLELVVSGDVASSLFCSSLCVINNTHVRYPFLFAIAVAIK